MKQHYTVNRKYSILIFFIVTISIQFYAVKNFLNAAKLYETKLNELITPYLEHPNFNKVVLDSIQSLSHQKNSYYHTFDTTIILTVLLVITATIIYSKGSKLIIANIFLLFIGCWISVYYLYNSIKPDYNQEQYLFFYILLPYITLILEHVLIGKKINITNEVRKNEEFIFKQKKDNLNDLIAMNLITQEDYLIKKKQLLKEELYSNKFSSPETLSLEKALKNGIISNEEFAIAFDKIIEKQINKILNTK